MIDHEKRYDRLNNMGSELRRDREDAKRLLDRYGDKRLSEVLGGVRLRLDVGNRQFRESMRALGK